MRVRETPYKGLVPYDESDEPFFFGRAAEREIVAANLMGSRLTLVYGPSGVGKSSLLRAGVVHDLRKVATEDSSETGKAKFVIVYMNSWRDEPLASFRAQVRREVKRVIGFLPAGLSPTDSLADELKLLADTMGGKLLIILDQFEEYFLYSQNESAGSFSEQLPRAINRPDVRANFIISLREDWYTK